MWSPTLRGPWSSGQDNPDKRRFRDTRNTVADQQGYYTFASVPVGAYNLTVTLAGFQTFEEDGIPLGGGESRSVNVSLQVGNTSQTVQVSGGEDLLTPVDSGSGP